MSVSGHEPRHLRHACTGFIGARFPGFAAHKAQVPKTCPLQCVDRGTARHVNLLIPLS